MPKNSWHVLNNLAHTMKSSCHIFCFPPKSNSGPRLGAVDGGYMFENKPVGFRLTRGLQSKWDHQTLGPRNALGNSWEIQQAALWEAMGGHELLY